jgi:hypothetical protein
MNIRRQFGILLAVFLVIASTTPTTVVASTEALFEANGTPDVFNKWFSLPAGGAPFVVSFTATSQTGSPLQNMYLCLSRTQATNQNLNESSLKIIFATSNNTESCMYQFTNGAWLCGTLASAARGTLVGGAGILSGLTTQSIDARLEVDPTAKTITLKTRQAGSTAPYTVLINNLDKTTQAPVWPNIGGGNFFPNGPWLYYSFCTNGIAVNFTNIKAISLADDAKAAASAPSAQAPAAIPAVATPTTTTAPVPPVATPSTTPPAVAPTTTPVAVVPLPAPAIAAPVIPSLIIPVGFDDEVGKSESIAVGGNAIYCISLDGKQLLSYNNETMNPNPWEPITLVGLPSTIINGVASTVLLEAVACGGDGTTCILDTNGAVYRVSFSNDQKTASCSPLLQAKVPLTGAPVVAPRNIHSIAVGSALDIWAVDSNKNILQFNGSDWVVRAAGVGHDVAVGADGHVVGINVEGDPFFFHNNGWIKLPVLPNDANIDQVAVVEAGDLYAISDNGLLWHYSTSATIAGQPAPKAEWKQLKDAASKPAAGFKTVAVNAASTIFLTTSSDDIYTTDVTFIDITALITDLLKSIAGLSSTPGSVTLVTAGTAVAPVAVAPVTVPTVQQSGIVAPVIAPATTIAEKTPAGDKVAVTKKAVGKKTKVAGAEVVSKAVITKKAPKPGIITRTQAKKSKKIDVKAQKAIVKTPAKKAPSNATIAKKTNKVAARSKKAEKKALQKNAKAAGKTAVKK